MFDRAFRRSYGIRLQSTPVELLVHVLNVQWRHCVAILGVGFVIENVVGVLAFTIFKGSSRV